MEFYFRLINHAAGEIIEFTTNCFDEAVNLWRERRWGADEGQLVARGNGVELVLDVWEGTKTEDANDERVINPFASCYYWDC